MAAFNKRHLLAATLIILRRRRRRRKNAAATLLNKNKRAWIRITNLDRQISFLHLSDEILYALYQKGQCTFVPR